MSIDRHIAIRQSEGKRRADVNSARHSKLTSPRSGRAIRTNDKSELELGMLQMQILWLLKRPAHGYALMRSLNELKQTKITQGTLYPALQRLEELGLVTRKRSSRRHVWTLTAKGKATMRRACLDFCKTFQGIFHDFVCGRCH